MNILSKDTDIDSNGKNFLNAGFVHICSHFEMCCEWALF